MVFHRLFLTLLFCVTVVEFGLYCQTRAGTSPTITAVRMLEPLRIDGRLNEPVWQREGETRFIQRRPDEGSPGSEKTEAWVAYDDAALYVAVKLYDSQPDSIVGRLARRDADSESDEVGVELDAAHDRRNGRYFIVNPVGAIQDGTFSNDTQTDGSWDGVWDVAVRIEPWGWAAEFRIPYSQLRFPKQDRYTWGIEIYRTIKRRNEETYLVLHPLTDRVRVSRWAELQGLEGITPPARMEILPYVTATGKFLQEPAPPSFNSGRSDPFSVQRKYPTNVGADAKLGLAGDVTLDLSLNPDFAQVEVDPAVVNLSAYEVYYQEKRPFFIEGSNIMEFGHGGASTLQNFNWTDPAFFYSRRIGRAPQGSVAHQGFLDIPDRTTILGAAKVSGKITNSWSFAALGALTDREYGLVDSAGARFKDEIEPLTFYGTVRTLKEFNGARQAIGVLGTVVERRIRENSLKSNLNNRALSLGFDGWTFLDENKVWVLTGWAGASTVSGSAQRITSLQRSAQHFFQRPDASYLGVDSSATSLTGWATRFWVDKVTGNWVFNAAFGAIHPNFETNDVGFLTRADIINSHIYAGYEWYDPGEVFRTKSIAAAIIREFDFGGKKTGSSFQLYLSGQLLNYWGANLSLGFNDEVFDDQRTRGGPLMKALSSHSGAMIISSDSRQALYGSLTTSAGKGESGNWLYTERLYLNLKVSKALNASVTLDFSRYHIEAQYVNAIADPLAPQTYGTRYVFGVLDQKQVSTALRLNWAFSPKLSFQLYLQPILSTGAYANIMELAQPGTFTFNRYGEKNSTITSTGGQYNIDPDGTGGPAKDFLLANPDFNFKSIRANAVFRWEYLPGSTIYFVWTNEKMDYESRGDFSLGRDVNRLLGTTPDNVFSIKITYWINP